MPTLRERLDGDMKDAMRARDTVRLGTIRMIRTALTERDKAGAGETTDADVLAVVTKQAKQRRDSIAQFEAAGREDLAAAERAELAVVEGYLPAQATDAEVDAAVAQVVAETGAATMKDMGRVMGTAIKLLGGTADGARVQAAVRKALGAGA
ncbi:MAG TPA: GatB/YqeY domain-containing protein [Rubricoccaceae bacterium]|jgi:hypothetical protein